MVRRTYPRNAGLCASCSFQFTNLSPDSATIEAMLAGADASHRRVGVRLPTATDSVRARASGEWCGHRERSDRATVALFGAHEGRRALSNRTDQISFLAGHVCGWCLAQWIVTGRTESGSRPFGRPKQALDTWTGATRRSRRLHQLFVSGHTAETGRLASCFITLDRASWSMSEGRCVAHHR